MDAPRPYMILTSAVGWLMQTVRDKCFTKCVTVPGRSLSAGEQTCLQRCVDRYGEVCPYFMDM
jgi:hypothetical protein